jgi:hypothetical protein
MKSGNNRIQDPPSRRRSAKLSENCTDNPPRLPVFPSILFKSFNFCFHFTHSHQFFFGAQEKFMTQYKFEPILTAIFFFCRCFHVNKTFWM